MKPTFIAKMRIRHNGKLYMPDDPIELDDEELKALPKGAVAALAAGGDTAPEGAGDNADATQPPLSAEEQEAHDKLVAAVDALDATAFKKDGGIRKDALEQLVADLGFAVTADDVATIVASKDA